jgi:hypothetical protein
MRLCACVCAGRWRTFVVFEFELCVQQNICMKVMLSYACPLNIGL